MKSDFVSWNERMAQKHNPHDFHTKSIYPIRWIERRRVKAIMKFLDPQRTDRILEIGCGAGNLMEAFRTGNAVGLDLSSFLLSFAKQKSYKTTTHFVRSFGESMPFGNSMFDKAYCSEVLEHVPEPSDVCKEAHRILKERGIFVVSVPNEKLIDFTISMSRKLSLNCAVSSDEWHLHKFDLRMLKKALEGLFVLEKVSCIPSKLFPVRIVACCRRV